MDEQTAPKTVSHEEGMRLIQEPEPDDGAVVNKDGSVSNGRQWPIENTSLWPLDKLLPYARNPKTHPPEQVELIARSLARFGQTQAVLLDGDDGPTRGEIIAGHGRVLAAEKLGWTHLRAAQARGWSDDEKRAYRIMDNELGSERLAPYDGELLKGELVALQGMGFDDMPLLGFDQTTLNGVLYGGLESSAPPERELDAADQRRLDGVWRVLIKEWQSIWSATRKRGYASPTYLRSALAVHFVRAQLYGHDIPRNATISYCLHRMSEVGDSGSMDDVFKRALEDDAVLHGLQFVMGGMPYYDKLFTGLAVHGHRMPQEFPALLARDLTNEFCPDGGTVLDPCHGWGGRLLGFLLSHASTYVGIDASKQTVEGVHAMANDLTPLAIGKRKVTLLNTPFEDAELPKDFLFDFALTSPPYYNTERYSGEQSSWRRYKSYDKWVAGFYEPLIAKVSGALRDGAVFALQVGSQAYPLEDDAKKIAANHKLAYLASRETGIVNTQMPHERAEVVVILRKQSQPIQTTVEPALSYGRVM